MESARAWTAWNTIKPLLGLLLLTLLIAWIAREGELLARLSTAAVFWSTLVSILTIGVNAIVLRSIAVFYGGRLAYDSALRLSALGALGNALGGIPIGTALKFALLYKDSGLKISEITSGMVAFSLATTFWLLLTATASSAALPLAGHIALLSILATIGFAVLAISAGILVSRNHRFAPLITPLLTKRSLLLIHVNGLAVATVFLSNYWVLGRLLAPEIDVPSLLFTASVGILISLGSLLQSVGGIHELAMGLSSTLSGLEAVTGIELALVMRLTAIIAAATMLALLMLPVQGLWRVRGTR